MGLSNHKYLYMLHHKDNIYLQYKVIKKISLFIYIKIISCKNIKRNILSGGMKNPKFGSSAISANILESCTTHSHLAIPM